MAVYPPETEANTPGSYPKRWYQRKFGPRWATSSGGTGGRNTSEDLQGSWTESIRGPLEREVLTSVSYAPYVQGAETQTTTHERIGWQTDKDVAEELTQDSGIGERMADEIEKALR